jgi:hypothetical protein
VGQEFNSADAGTGLLRKAVAKMKHPLGKPRLRIGNKTYG